MKKFIPYLELIRPPNLITAAADILAGFAISGSILHFSIFGGVEISISEPLHLWLLIFASICIYGGGITLNDVFDAFADAVERPERPIPRRAITRQHAMIFGYLLLMAGTATALFVGYVSGVVALLVAGCAVLYNYRAKHHLVFGPLTMGLCRAGNLLLGMTAVPDAFFQEYSLAIIPLIYIASVTLIGRGEVSGGRRSWLLTGGFGYLVTIIALLILTFKTTNILAYNLLLIGLFALNIITPLAFAIVSKDPSKIGLSVKKGVLSIIVLDAFFVAANASILLSIITLMLYPITIFAARHFSVT